MQLLKRAVLYLANTLGTDTEPGGDLAERLRRAAEAVARADHGSLTLVQVREQIGDRSGQPARVDTLIRVLGGNVGEHFRQAGTAAPIGTHRLIEPASVAPGAGQALDLP